MYVEGNILLILFIYSQITWTPDRCKMCIYPLSLYFSFTICTGIATVDNKTFKFRLTPYHMVQSFQTNVCIILLD